MDENLTFIKDIEQENLCIRTEYIINLLITYLFQIERLPQSDFKVWKKQLSKMRSEIHRIYWEL